MDIATLKDIATIVGAVIALATLVVGVREYSRGGATKRAEHFLEMRKRLKGHVSFKVIADLIEKDDPKLREITFEEKRDFLGLFEEVAIGMNSGLIRKQVAHYMFGYYAIRCWESDNFWIDAVNRDSPYWAVFRDFAEEMIQTEKKFKYRRRDFVF